MTHVRSHYQAMGFPGSGLVGGTTRQTGRRVGWVRGVPVRMTSVRAVTYLVGVWARDISRALQRAGVRTVALEHGTLSAFCSTST